MANEGPPTGISESAEGTIRAGRSSGRSIPSNLDFVPVRSSLSSLATYSAVCCMSGCHGISLLSTQVKLGYAPTLKIAGRPKSQGAHVLSEKLRPCAHVS